MTRTKPYTEIGISRVPCTRCGKPSVFQWNACADGRYRGLCARCDVALNAVAMRFMRIPGWRAKLRAYRKKLLK